MKKTKYKIEYTFSSRDDMRKMKRYILDTFKYRELGKNFTNKMKEASEGIKLLPTGFNKTEFCYRGYNIHMRVYRTYLFFYIVEHERKTVTILRVMQDGMNWKYLLDLWLKEQV